MQKLLIDRKGCELMALVRKILETTLAAGATSVSFTDTDIPNSLLRLYTSQPSLFPLSQTLSGNTVTVNFKAQSAGVGVALEIVKQGLDIVDDLTSEDTDKALSAKQGYILKGLIDGIVIPTVPENITDLDDVDVTSIQNGQVLAWNSTSEKFENVNQSGSGGVDYSTSEQNTGIKYTNGKYVYQKTIHINSVTSGTSYQHDISNVDRIWIHEVSAVRNTGWFSSGHIFQNGTSNISESFSVIPSAESVYCYLYGCTITDCDITLRYTKTS